jgi:polyisoprenyl-phosphate glycosyltransferase
VEKKLISIVCPIYNEEDSIIIFYNRLIGTISQLEEKYNFELIFTNNSSSDKSIEIIKDICDNDNKVNLLTFSRNIGYQKSMLAGIHHSYGDALICIDVDCEDPPEMIKVFLEYWEEGFDVVYGERDKRKEPKIIELFRKLFYRLINAISDNETIIDMAEFALFSKRVKEIIIANRSTFPFIRNEIAYSGFKRKGIRYNRSARSTGKTHYNLITMTKFAIAGILTSSTFPLRFTMYLSIPILMINIVYLFLYLFNLSTNLLELIILLDAILLVFAVSFISIYVSRIYQDIAGRPIFIIDWKNSIMHSLKKSDQEKNNN